MRPKHHLVELADFSLKFTKSTKEIKQLKQKHRLKLFHAQNNTAGGCRAVIRAVKQLLARIGRVLARVSICHGVATAIKRSLAHIVAPYVR
jgi:hypothetical protein